MVIEVNKVKLLGRVIKNRNSRDADNARFNQTSSAPKLNWFGRNIVKPIVDLVNGTP